MLVVYSDLMIRNLTTLTLFSIFFSSGCSQSQDNTDIFNAIDSVNKKLASCTNEGNAECAAMYYTENAVYIGPNMKPLVGRDEIRAGMVDDGSTLLTLQADEIEVFGNTVNELGTFTTKTKSGELVDTGSYVVVWKKTDDGWKLHWDIFNSNLPLN